ncbi:ankyrin repeat domain-containing protein [Maribacter sp. MJ134]|uniref:ankyrin repeat domain-containing protein n=1 Tax=Maribacter sp. MJ134 TaxID=2496865 RepID=UPI000F82A9D2|nr:ankyrin repeat domain-containing protein [Maribacter sp. MJ134]AZQ59430.1 ankyrin repeat domain-containing protein [Maribacter sp. MJ134]
MQSLSKLTCSFLALLCITLGLAQENVFLSRDYWKANPSIDKIEADISEGNDIAQLNGNMFDAVSYALLAETDNSIVKYLLTKKGNEVDKITHDGRTYIFWAAYRNNLDIVKYLVENGAKADVKDSHGYNVINFAARAGITNTTLYDFLLKHKADINDVTNNGANALLLVAPSVLDYATIAYFNMKGLDLESTDDEGNNLFHYAARGGNIELLKKLIEKGLSYNSLNKLGGNAILMASQGADQLKDGLTTFKYLENLGLEANITDKQGRNPLHAIAYKSDDLSLFEYFIEKGVDVNKQDKGGDSPFMNAANSNTLSVVEFLFDYVEDINTKDENGRSALAMAVNRNSADIVKYLLQKGADSKTVDVKGNSLAYYLMNSFNAKKPEVFEAKLKALQKSGLVMTTAQNNGNTLLHLAAKENDLTLLKRLEKFNIGINQRNNDGNTALHLAAMSSHNETILKYLIAQGADKSLKTEFEETVYDLVSENELLREQLNILDYLK